MRVYFSHPILGKDLDSVKEDIFNCSLDFVRWFLKRPENSVWGTDDISCIRPLDLEVSHIGQPCPPDAATSGGPHTFGCYLRTDLKAMLSCDTIVLCPGWTSSRGAKLELDVALQCGLKLYEASKDYEGDYYFRKLDE